MARYSLLGVTADYLTISELNALVTKAILQDERWIIGHHNLHSVYLFHNDSKMRAFYSRTKVAPVDGMSLVAWGRILGLPLRGVHRVTYLDWVVPLMTAAREGGWRIYYLGGWPGVAERAAQSLREQLPGLQLRTHHGYLTGKDAADVLGDIASHSPQILMVGMGMPLQEHWVLDNLEQLHANAILTSGACFDYLAGVIPTPPRWTGRMGLEWLYRLVREPRRLGRRYLWEPWFLLPIAMNDLRKRLGI